ncbi:MAG: AAA family ATPase [Leptospirales bacterium]|jgi:HTH-type transcriptional repressor of NAD biosynthesis genes
MTTFKRGLIIGKFMPFHEGHRHLIDSARARVGELHVLVCTLSREIIPGEIRYQWLRKHYAQDPGVHVHHNTDENPQEPHEDPDFWRIWRTSIRRFFSPEFDRPLPETLFSSETYGDELARVLGIRHETIDLKRLAVPTSGTAIRNAPYRLRARLPEITRPYFIKKIVVTGPESCGKTTLAARLAAHYGSPWCHEYAREFLEARRIPVDELKAEHIPEIARGQAALEDRMTLESARENSGLLILDTDLIVTKIYARHYFGTCPEWIQRAARERAAKYDLQLLLTPEAPWVPDQLRNLNDMRAEMFHIFERELREHAAPFRVLPLPADLPEGRDASHGSNPDASLESRFRSRFEEAVRLIDAALAAPLRAASGPCGQDGPA